MIAALLGTAVVIEIAAEYRLLVEGVLEGLDLTRVHAVRVVRDRLTHSLLFRHLLHVAPLSLSV